MALQPDATAAEPVNAPSKPPFLRRVRIRGYKSIAFCDVTLEPLTVFVGRNASGKSNFLDALAFLRDVVVKGVQEAVKLHGGRDAILCRFSTTRTVMIEIETSFLPQKVKDAWSTRFGMEIELLNKQAPRIVREYARVEAPVANYWSAYKAENGQVSLSSKYTGRSVVHWRTVDRVFLDRYTDGPDLDFRKQVEAIATYNINPDEIRRPQKPVPGGFLERDGRNLASAIETTKEIEPETIERAVRYLTAITGTVEYAGILRAGGYETLRFSVPHGGNGKALEFDAASMSDGTLRAFAALIAAYQMALPVGYPSVVGIEEPETALHPAATRALVDALDEATLRTQILLTTHSADMLDNPTIRPENVRVVQMIDGQTVIGTVDEASVDIVRRNLNTLGGLERDNLLEPNLDDLDRQRKVQAEQETPA